MIDAGTKLVALIGDPVAHSVSPAMQNAAFKALSLNYVYLAFRVSSAAIGDAINGIRGLGLRGANITIPHKTAVLPLLDEIVEQARRIGAVNTIVNEGGKLIGHNTDTPGFLAALGSGGFEPNGQKAVVLGAGGAARAIIFALRDAGATVAIVNRSPEAAIALARETGSSAFELSESGLQSAMAGASLVVNATNVGMSPDVDSTPLPTHLLRPGLVVFDTVYRPRQTHLLKEAAAAGCVAIGGLEMLVEQGALAFELWTGKNAPRDIMRRAVVETLTSRVGEVTRNPWEPVRSMKTNIALIGFMGSGKSTAGKRLARRLQREFIETDRLIEERTGTPIAGIFQEQGEAGFRDIEEAVIKDLAASAQNAVIACGGGVVLRQANIDRLKETSTIIYLDTDTAALQDRLATSLKRPLLNRPDRDQFIEELHEARRPLYQAAADITIKTRTRPFAAVISEIIEKLGIDESHDR